MWTPLANRWYRELARALETNLTDCESVPLITCVALHSALANPVIGASRLSALSFVR